MTNYESGKIIIDYFYEEGDIDWILFSQILGNVEYGIDDVDLGKSPEKILEDAFKLVSYLISTGDFEVGTVTNAPLGYAGKIFPGNYAFTPYSKNMVNFKQDVIKIIAEKGMSADDFMLKISLFKKNKGALPPSSIPKEIMELFKPA